MKTLCKPAALLPLLGLMIGTAPGCHCGASRPATPIAANTPGKAVDSRVQQASGTLQDLSNQVKTGAQQTAGDVKQGAQATTATAEQDLNKTGQKAFQNAQDAFSKEFGGTQTPPVAAPPTQTP